MPLGEVTCNQQVVCLQTSYLPDVCIRTLNQGKLDVKGTPSLQKGSQKGSFCYAFERINQSLMNCSLHWQSAFNLRTQTYLETLGRRKMWACIFDAGPLGLVVQNCTLILKASIASGSRWGRAACELSALLRAGVSTGVFMRQQLKLVLKKTKKKKKKEILVEERMKTKPPV